MENYPYIKNLTSGESYDLPANKPGIVFSMRGNLSWLIPGFPEISCSFPAGMFFYCETAKVTAIEEGEFLFFPIDVLHSTWNGFLDNITYAQNENEIYSSPVYIRKHIKDFLFCIRCYLEDEVYSEELQGIKTQELLMLLNFYYSHEELGRIFYLAIIRNNELRKSKLNAFIEN